MGLRFCVIIILIATACSTSTNKERGEAEVLSNEDRQDYFKNKVEVEHAKNFTVSYHGNYKLVKAKVGFGAVSQDADSLSWSRAFSDKMVLVQRGSNPPPLNGELAGAHIIEIPVETIAGNADDAPTRFITLGVADKIVGLGHEGVYDPNLRKRFVEGELSQIGASWHTGPNFETLLVIKPDLSLLTAASLTQSEGISKTRELGLKAAPDFSWSETSYLGQLEWIKYDALFLNKEAAANHFFEEIKARCDSLQKLVEDKNQMPGAMWGMHRKSGAWTLRVNGAIAQLIEAAGATNPFANKNAAVTETQANGISEGIRISDEFVLEKAKEVDFIISFQSTTENWPPDSHMKDFPAFEKRNLYHHFSRYKDYGAYDWYQTASMRPDILLKDLIKLFHPEVLPEHELFFMDKIQVK
ncbi:MAG: ABC transporter substrate-binding protein [Bacteroidota bacterium]